MAAIVSAISPPYRADFPKFPQTVYINIYTIPQIFDKFFIQTPNNGFPMRNNDTNSKSYLAHAQFIYNTRRLRFSSFGDHSSIFKDPAWDILLNLYIAHHNGIKLMKTDAAMSGEVPEATGFRVIRDLQNRGLVESIDDFPGKKKVFISITGRAGLLIENTLQLKL